MKYIVKIDSIEVILDQDRLDQLVDLLVGTEKMDQVYIGNKQGDDGTNYSKLIRSYEPSIELPVRCLHDGTYTMRKMRTEAHDNKN